MEGGYPPYTTPLGSPGVLTLRSPTVLSRIHCAVRRPETVGGLCEVPGEARRQPVGGLPPPADLGSPRRPLHLPPPRRHQGEGDHGGGRVTGCRLDLGHQPLHQPGEQVDWETTYPPPPGSRQMRGCCSARLFLCSDSSSSTLSVTRCTRTQIGGWWTLRRT